MDHLHHAYALFLAAMGHEVGGMRMSTILVTLVLLPVVNEVVARHQKITAQSLVQAVGNAFKASPLYNLPKPLLGGVFRAIIDLLATPETVQPAPAPRDEVKQINVDGKGGAQ